MNPIFKWSFQVNGYAMAYVKTFHNYTDSSKTILFSGIEKIQIAHFSQLSVLDG